MLLLSDNTYLVIDFDSTFVKDEGLESLAEISLSKKENKEEIIQEIKDITDKGMAGQISFADSLRKRVELIEADKEDIRKLAEKFKTRISDSISENKAFFKNNTENIYIISGGFKEFILPVVEDFGLKEDNVLANNFCFSEEGKVSGFNEAKYLAQEKGKIKQMKELGLEGRVFVIGDGWTDFEIKKEGMAEKFIAFAENRVRPEVLQAADFIAYSFKEVLAFLSLFRAV
jgi:D-3-phosphoglycerate dehydrogenase